MSKMRPFEFSCLYPQRLSAALANQPIRVVHCA